MFSKNRLTIYMLIIASILSGILAGTVFTLFRDLPQIRALETFRPASTTRIYSADNVVLAELFIEKRDPVRLKVIPPLLISALIATEDRKFYEHSGVDLKGILRAAIKDILAGEFVEGASTLTQQLAKTLFLTPQKTLIRKLKEAILSFQLERRYTKNEILELYLNQVYFGSGAYGVEAAARRFFNKSAADLDLAECALIAAMPKAPSRYSPLVDPDLAVKRRNIVLNQMKAVGAIDEQNYQKANKQPYLSPRNENQNHAHYFVEYVKAFLEDTVGSTILYKGGLTIFTTLSYKMQIAAEKAIHQGLEKLRSRRQNQDLTNIDPQGALVAIDIRSGRILSMVGGTSFSQSRFNRVTSAKRQPGSAFKPIIYAYAVEQGFPQNKKILDAPISFKGRHPGQVWKPENFSHQHKGDITLREALAISQNVPAVKLLEMLGPSSVIRFSRKLGIQSALSADLSLALGTSTVSLLNLASAYTVFPNKGKRTEPYGVLEVIGPDGQSLWRVRPKEYLVMKRAAAAIITNMLEAVITEGTGSKAGRLSHPVGGKTGTTNGYKDALFIGFTPEIVAGVWVGCDDNSTLGEKETGARAALPIWFDFMVAATADKQYLYFDIPDNVVQIQMNPKTGLRAKDESKNIVTALFLKGTQP